MSRQKSKPLKTNKTNEGDEVRPDDNRAEPNDAGTERGERRETGGRDHG